MQTSTPPHRLNEGILLEDTGVLIPWGTPVANLADIIQSTSVLRHEDSIHLTLEDRLCLGGLRCDVRATQIFERPDPRAYHLYLPEIHWVSFDILSLADESDVTTRFKRLFQHLRDQFGEASWSYPSYHYGLPAIGWELGTITIQYAPLAGCRVAIEHEPVGYDDLKAEARRLQAGPDARVNYVAW